MGNYTTLYGRIISLSSWSRMWQCQTYPGPDLGIEGECTLRLRGKSYPDSCHFTGYTSVWYLSIPVLRGRGNLRFSLQVRGQGRHIDRWSHQWSHTIKGSPGSLVFLYLEWLAAHELELDQVQVDRVGIRSRIYNYPILSSTSASGSSEIGSSPFLSIEKNLCWAQRSHNFLKCQDSGICVGGAGGLGM